MVETVVANNGEQVGQPERRIGRGLKSKSLGRLRVTFGVGRADHSANVADEPRGPCRNTQRGYPVVCHPGRRVQSQGTTIPVVPWGDSRWPAVDRRHGQPIALIPSESSRPARGATQPLAAHPQRYPTEIHAGSTDKATSTRWARRTLLDIKRSRLHSDRDRMRNVPSGQ